MIFRKTQPVTKPFENFVDIRNPSERKFIEIMHESLLEFGKGKQFYQCIFLFLLTITNVISWEHVHRTHLSLFVRPVVLSHELDINTA